MEHGERALELISEYQEARSADSWPQLGSGEHRSTAEIGRDFEDVLRVILGARAG